MNLLTLTLANDIEILSQNIDNCDDLYRQVLKLYYLTKSYLPQQVINMDDIF